MIVSDIGMPEKDGLEMIRELRAKNADEAKTPALALTAFARSEDRTRAMLAGYQVHLAEPAEAQELIAAVATSRDEPDNKSKVQACPVFERSMRSAAIWGEPSRAATENGAKEMGGEPS